MKKNFLKKIFVLLIVGISFLGSNLVLADVVIPEIEEPAVTLVSIAITSETEAVKTEYFVGEEIDISGLEVIGNYSDNHTQIETITTDNITGFDSSSAVVGQILTITILDKTTTYLVNINNITSVDILNKIIIRNGDSIIYDGEILFPETEQMISILDQEVDNKSVLGLLYSLDQQEDSFSISDLIYNESFESFLLNCITPQNSQPLCYNWQYVVNGNYSQFGMDKNILEGGDNIYLFFGQADRILLNSNSIHSEQDLIVTTEKYDFENNGWLPKQGVVVGVTQVNPNDPFNPIEIQTGQVDEEGQKTFSLIPVGSYSAGIKVEDNGYSYYWPTVNFEVVTSSSDGNNGGGETIPDMFFSVPNAISFLLNNQNSDGSFQNDMYTDWAAIAIASTDEGNLLKSKIKNYLASQEFLSSLLTDNERHAMALMAMDIDPYNGTDINYIQKIVDSFDGVQLGEEDLVNDDIFGLLVLSKAGYEESDEIISKTLEFIIDQQENNGSFGSIDLTSAFIQIVQDFDDTLGLNEAREKAENYLVVNQDASGSFGNPFSTSWVLQALSVNSAFENEMEKAKGYLRDKQEEDGGVGELSDSLNNRIWATSYAIPAVLQLAWVDILESFEKEEIFTSNIDEEEKIEEKLLSEIIEIPIIEEIILESEKINTDDILSSKKQVVNSKEKDKEIITNYELKIINENDLLANAIGAFAETNEEKSLFFQKLNNFFQRIFSYIKTFRHRLLTIE